MEISQGGSYSELSASADTGEQVTITGAVNPNVGTATREVVITGNRIYIHEPLSACNETSRAFGG